MKGYVTDLSSEGTRKEDEFDVYGQFIAAQLRQMDLQIALKVQLEIQNIISRARLCDLHND